MRVIRKMQTPVGIGIGQTASVTLPRGMTYHRFYITARADFGAGVVDVPEARWNDLFSEIRLMVDGSTKIQLTGGDLVALNNFYGYAHKTGVIPLFLSRPWGRTPMGEDQTSYGTNGGMRSFTLEMDIKATVTAVEKIEVRAVQEADGQPFGPHLRIQRYVHTQGVTGEAEISDVKRGPYAAIAMHLDTSSISDVEVLADNYAVHQSDAVTRAAHAEVAKRVPQAGYTHIDFIGDNRLPNAMPMTLNDFRLKPTFTATGNFRLLVEAVEGNTAR
jgi:hypothetical protein